MPPPPSRSAGTPDPLDAAELERDAAFARRLAASLVGAAAADDVVQDAWRALVERPPRHRASPRGYLATLVRRLALRRRRTEGRRAAREHAAARGGHEPAADELVARLEIHGRLVRAVLALAEPYRATVLLRFFEDLAPAEIARRQGVPVETVRTRLKRALASLRAELGGEDAEPRDWLPALAALARGGAPAGDAPPAPRAGVARDGAAPAAAAATHATSAALVVVGLLVAAVAWVALGARPRSAPEGSGPGPLAGAAPTASDAPGSAARADLGRTPLGPAAPPDAGAERASAPRLAAAPEPDALRGRVLDANGLGIAGASVGASEVRLSGLLSIATVATDAEGRYELPLDALRRLSWAERVSLELLVTVEAAGFRPARATWRLDPHAGALARDWTLAPGRMLVGSLVDEEGNPVGHALVHVRLGPDALAGAWTDPVDAAGVFRVPLEEGQVPLDVQAWSRGRLAGRLAPELLAAARERDGRLELPPLVLGRAASIGGSVRTPDGAPAAFVPVAASAVARDASGAWRPAADLGVREGGLASGSARTDAEGRFRIDGLRAGAYRVQAGGATVAPVLAGALDARLTLEERRVVVRVADEEGRLLEGVPVAFATLEGEAGAPRRVLRTFTAGDPPTAATVAAPGATVVLGAYVPGAPAAERRVVVPALPYETVEELVVAYAPPTAALAVQLAGAPPGTRAQVRLLAEGTRVAVGVARTTDAEGRAWGLAAGRWLVEVDPLPAQGEEDCYAPCALVPLALEPGASSALAVDAVPGARLAIALALPGEEPRASFLPASDGGLDTWMTWAPGSLGAVLCPEGDAARALELPGVQPGVRWESAGALPAGRWLLRASFPGALPVERWIALEPCRAAEERVELVVEDASGAAAHGGR